MKENDLELDRFKVGSALLLALIEIINAISALDEGDQDANNFILASEEILRITDNVFSTPTHLNVVLAARITRDTLNVIYSILNDKRFGTLISKKTANKINKELKSVIGE